MSLRRREVLLASAGIAGSTLLPASGAIAAIYPDKPIKLVLSFPPGSTSDLLARYVGEKAGKLLGQPLIIESKAGAQGAIAARLVAKSPADGYTIFLGTNSTHAANVYLLKNLGYDPIKDFTPLTQCAINPLLLVVNAKLPIHSVTELVQYAKQRPGQLSYGSGNTGSLVAAHLFNKATGIKAVGVNYPGVAQACTDLVGGRLEFMMVDPTVVRPFLAAGKARVLGITSKHRLASMSEVMPLASLGVTEFTYASWAGFFAPAGLPEGIQKLLQATFAQVLSEPDTAQYLSSMGMIVQHSSSENFSEFVKAQVVLWGHLVKESGLNPL